MITLLTEPSLYPWFQFYKFCKNVAKRLMGRPVLWYSGHFAVVRSITTGLKEGGIPFNYNPAIPSISYKHVHVLGNTSALKMAIILKRLGIIKNLTAGPNIVISSAEAGGILASKHINKVIVPSEWVKQAYLLDNDRLLPEKMVVWPAGIDANYWNIEKVKANKRNFLFYVKRPEKELLEACELIAHNNDIGITKIYHGGYKLDEFRDALARAECVVYFVEQESQGIALAEIWAADVPTLVWNPGVWHYKLKNYKCSSAPYLTDSSGCFFKNATEFEAIVNNVINKKYVFSPRRYALENFTDVITARDFVLKVID